MLNGKSKTLFFAINYRLGDVRLAFSGANITYALFRAGKKIAGELSIKNTDVLGWFSPSYSVKQPALFLATAVKGKAPLRLISKWGLGITDPASLEIQWNTPRTDKSQAIYNGEQLDF